MDFFKILKTLLSKKTKSYLFLLTAFSVFVSIIETIGVSAIMPFIDVVTNFDTIHNNKYYQWIFVFFNFKNEIDFAIAFGAVLIGFYIFRGGVNILYSYHMANFGERLYAQITKKLFKVYLGMPYQVFTNKNSSYLTKTIVTEAAMMSVVVRTVLLIMSEIFVIIFLYIVMLAANWEITLFFTIILVIKMFFLTKMVSKKIKSAGTKRATIQAQFYEIINQLFGNFKQTKLQDNERLEAIEKKFDVAVSGYANENATYVFLNTVSRPFLETVGFVLIASSLTVLLYLNQSNISHILPILSLFIVAMYRLLPSVNRIVNGYNTLLYHYKSINIINEEMQVVGEDLGNKTLRFSRKIELKDVFFSYKGEEVLKEVRLTINKGDNIAIVGGSGSGKSTLLDLIIGLNRPDQGQIKIDGVLLDKQTLQNWRSQIGFIPQQVYLFDGTILENVCFGRKVDRILLEKVLKKANIFSFLQSRQGVETLVGEGGVQLSGGQKQRIAIARALYGEPEILVLDEATSALDNKTEQKIMSEIYEVCQKKTLIIVAHRLSTIKNCDKVYEIKKGIVTEKRV